MRRFLDIVHPNWNTELITTGFEFDPKQLHGREGFPAEAKRRVALAGTRNDPRLGKWAENAVAQQAEYKVVRMLERLFANEVATIISGYKETSLGNIVKCLSLSGNTPDMPLSQEVSKLPSHNQLIKTISRRRICGVSSAEVMCPNLKVTCWPGLGPSLQGTVWIRNNWPNTLTMSSGRRGESPPC